DVWGRIRSKKAAAKADSEALEADYEFARQSLAAAVARAYFTVIEAAEQEANAQATLDIYEQYSQLTDVQKQHEFANEFDGRQIRKEPPEGGGHRDRRAQEGAARDPGGRRGGKTPHPRGKF